MTLFARPWLVGIVSLLATVSSYAASDVTLFRLFMLDGTTLVSYGEFARVDDRVVLSIPLGGSRDEPRLHVVSVPATKVDWPRTERYAQSARYQQYAAVRGEADFQALSNDVARTLNDIALSTDPAQALAIAENARRMLVAWPAAHMGYRQQDVREIVVLVQDAIAKLKGQPSGALDLALISMTTPVLEPVLGLPTPAEQLTQLQAVIASTTGSAERIALLQSGLLLLRETPGMAGVNVDASRKTFERQLQGEVATDARYARLSSKLTKEATGAAARANVTRVQRVLDRIEREDTKLGGQRPDMMLALRAAVHAQLDAARFLRLQQAQWVLRRAAFQRYQRVVEPQIADLLRAESALEAIRTLEGPSPRRLLGQQARLAGGAARLQRVTVPDEFKGPHDLLVGAWRFAESAFEARVTAAKSGNVTAAWEASSAAAGALMLLTRAQQELKTLLEPPRLQ